MTIYLGSKRLSWKAERIGRIYCAPACGARCTYAAYQQAQRKAARLASVLKKVDTDIKGGRWKPLVHENLGWHYQVTKGSVSVYEYEYVNYRRYSACLNMSGPWGGNLWRDGETPAAAVENLLAEAKALLVDMVRLAKAVGL